MPTKTEAIKKFLEIKTIPDLANLYNFSMECQVNVAQDGGQRINGEFKGQKWHGWTDDLTTWKPFRIPWKANAQPEYTDTRIVFDLAEHAEGIGMTGWDWENQVSKWVAFDFDAIIGHSDKHETKLTNEELKEVEQEARSIEWVTIRKSTSGKGLHFYVFVDDVPTKNHNEHAALARSILGTLSAITGFNFQSKVDNCGGLMWVWHRKMEGTDGLTLIKEGIVLKNIPQNWKDHVKVITGRKRKALPQQIEDSGITEIFEEITGQRPRVNLDSDHKKLIEYLRSNECLWWWDQDHYMLVTHTIHLQEAFNSLSLKGYFKTDSTGTEHGQDHNCFCYPLRKGAWVVRRYTPGVREHDSWQQDGSGWTRCYYNREPDIATASRAYGAIEDPAGGFVFREAEIAEKAAKLVGVGLEIGVPQRSRKTILKKHRDGRLIVEIDKDDNDDSGEMKGWLPKGKKWTRIFNTQNNSPAETEIGCYDDTVRHLVTTSNEDYGWMIRSDGNWHYEPLTHTRLALSSQGYNSKEITGILGISVFKPWRVVNKPFQPEYPGNREWNRNAAQLRFLPTQDTDNLTYPHWALILNHCGNELNDALSVNPWAKANGIINGADYLKCWISSLFQEPTEPLPYLFFYGPQNSGKSIFHEALSLLITKGYRRADAALASQGNFNGELEGAIICVSEEINLAKNRQAYERIKDWVTSRDLNIHAKGKTPFHVPNTTHWIQCSNDHKACPIFSGDTRITMLYVPELDILSMIPKKNLIPLLEKEAPNFLAEILKLELPPSNDRLNVPVITTADKNIAEQLNRTMLEIFVDDKCSSTAGKKIKFSDFFAEFQQWLDPAEVGKWSKIIVGRQLPPHYPKGRSKKDNQVYIGNISWRGRETDDDIEIRKYTIEENYLVGIKCLKNNSTS